MANELARNRPTYPNWRRVRDLLPAADAQGLFADHNYRWLFGRLWDCNENDLLLRGGDLFSFAADVIVDCPDLIRRLAESGDGGETPTPGEEMAEALLWLARLRPVLLVHFVDEGHGETGWAWSLWAKSERSDVTDEEAVAEVRDEADPEGWIACGRFTGSAGWSRDRVREACRRLFPNSVASIRPPRDTDVGVGGWE